MEGLEYLEGRLQYYQRKATGTLESGSRSLSGVGGARIRDGWDEVSEMRDGVPEKE